MSDHPLTVRAMGLMDVPVSELRAIERRPPDAAARLERFKEDIRKSYKRGVLKHHPDRGGNAEDLMTITKFADWVKGWKIKPPPRVRRMVFGSPSASARMHEQMMADLMISLVRNEVRIPRAGFNHFNSMEWDPFVGGYRPTNAGTGGYRPTGDRTGARARPGFEKEDPDS